jgi:hypothetical protein
MLFFTMNFGLLILRIRTLMIYNSSNEQRKPKTPSEPLEQTQRYEARLSAEPALLALIPQV